MRQTNFLLPMSFNEYIITVKVTVQLQLKL
jgi:hypothetical protein